MNPRKLIRAGTAKRSLLPLSVSVLTLCTPRLIAATETWNVFTGTNNWSVGASWLDGTAPAGGDPTLDAIFGGAGTDTYTANNDIVFLLLNTLTLTSNSTGVVSIAGSVLDFNVDNTPAAINQNGSGAITIDAGINATNDLTLAGTGSGVVTINGAISGGGGLTFGGGNWQLTNTGNTFTGPISINTGSFVELIPAGLPPQSVSLALGGATLLGSNAPLTINGGTLKVTTVGSGNMNVGRTITFGGSGGILDLRNSNTVDPPTQGGNIAGGDLTLVLNNAAGTPAVIKWNGGQVGLSNNNPTDGNIATGTNALRFAALSGTGPLRIELTNGAVLRGSTGGSGTINVPITVRGAIGGDPTSGPGGTVLSGISLNMGRYVVDSQNVTNHTAGITFQGAVQISVAGSTRALDGNITVAGTASGAPGFVAFSGRGTGTQLNSTLNNPGTNTAGQNPLWLGQGQNDFLTIEDGGVAVFDNRVRTDTGGRNGNGVVLDGTAVLNAGALLRIQQSISNFTPGVAATDANVGDVVIRGDIRGEGTTSKESVLEIALPAPQPGSPVSSTIPATLTATTTVAGERPYGGVRFEDVTGNADFVVNGTGFGGLRINGIPRPSALISGGGADPVSNASKLNDALTATRLARVSGTGGYLTIAPTNEMFSFPVGGMWADTDVGLKTVNQNPAGADLSLATLTTWSRNLAVDTGATLDLGSANPFVVDGGTINGVGTITGTGSLQVGAAANLAPGLSGVGTLVLSTGVQLSGNYLVDVTPTAADVVTIGGNLTLGGPITFTGTYGTTDLTIATYTGTLTGVFGPVSGLNPNFVINYGTGTNSVITLKFTSTPTLKWQGSPGATWSVGGGNWQSGAIFANTNKVVFDDTATGSTTVTISGGDVSPNLITVNNVAKNYTIVSGVGTAMVGPAQLVKTGTGQLTLSGPANYSGGTAINGGTLKLGSNNALPDSGTISVAAGATLDTQGNSDTVADLQVNGSVLGALGTLTMNSLALGDGAVFQPRIVLKGNLTKTGTIGTTIGGTIDLDGGNRTFDVALGTSPELTLNGIISNGGLTKNGNGTLVLGNGGNSFNDGVVVNAGTLFVGGAGALPSGKSLTVNGGTLDGNNTSINVSSLSGTGGTLSLGSGSLSVAQDTDTAYTGAITGFASVTKTGAGVLTLNGNGSTYTGGLFVTAGTVIVSSTTGAGTGITTVNPGTTLQVGAALTSPILLAGGRLASQGSPAAVTSNQLTVSSDSTVLIANSITQANSEVIVTGTLDGTGNLSVSAGPGQTNPDGGVGFRLRGGAGSYSGTITANSAVKLEVQTTQAGPFTPAGTGKFVFNGGTFTSGTVNGNYTQFNIRNNNAGGDTIIGNDVSVVGSGFVNMNMPGNAPQGSRTDMGMLQIGDGQTLGVNRNGTPSHLLAFSGVTLTGGMATFAPQTPNFGVTGTSELTLGPIGESVAGSGFTMDGLSTLYLTGNNSYTGPTRIQNGTVRIGAVGALPSGTNLTVEAGTLDLFHPTLGSFDQTVASLSGTLGVVTNSDFITTRTMTIDQAVDTVFGGSFSQLLGVTKKGAGKLTLTGASSNTEPITINAGTVVVNGSVTCAINGQSGGVLRGSGTIGNVNFAAGSKIAPGDGIGTLSLSGGLLSPGAILELDITGITAGTLYDQLLLSGALDITNSILALQLGAFDPADFTDQFTIILNNGASPVTGTFQGLANGAIFLRAGQIWQISYFDDASTPGFELAGGNDVTLLAMPEPGAVASLIGGIGMLLGMQRFRKGR
jgi:autotransporter-associated beta strand protein